MNKLKGNEIATFEDEQVMKGLECCVVRNIDCISCPYYEKAYCVEVDAFDLIKRQKAEKEAMQQHIGCLRAEVERLEKILDERCDVCPAVTSAIKDFAEKLKEYYPSIAKGIDYTAEEVLKW